MHGMNWLMSVVQERLDVPRISLALPDISEDTPPGTLRIGSMLRDMRELEWRELPAEGTYCARVMKEAQSLAVTSVQHSDLSKSGVLMEQDEIVSYLGAPVPAVTGGAVGTLSALHVGARIWSRQDRVDLEHFAHWVGLKIAPTDVAELPDLRRGYAR